MTSASPVSLAPLLLWFAVIVCLIPLALWLLKRTPLGGGGAFAGQGVLRPVAVLPLSGTQRVVTVEVGQGDARHWLVLGVTPQQITALHTMAPQGPASPGTAGRAGPPAAPAPFADLFAKLRPRGPGDA